jgi:hypothetical protein
VKNEETKMIVGSAVKAKTKPLAGPSALPSVSWLASAPNTNCEPAFVNSRKRLTPSPIVLKRA